MNWQIPHCVRGGPINLDQITAPTMPQKSSRKDTRSPTPPASAEVIIVRANEFHADTQTPCRLIFVIPVELPPLLNPSIPPPPYNPLNPVDHPVLYDLTRTALRPVVIGAVFALLGPDAAVSKMVPRHNRDWRQPHQFVSRVVTDRSKFNLESGHWTDQYGVEGFDPKAYIDLGDHGFSIVEAYQIRADQGIKDNKTNPLILEVKAMPVLTEGKVAFLVRKYEDWEQKHFNHNVWLEEW